MAHSTLPFKSILNFIERSTDKRNGESLEINNIFFIVRTLFVNKNDYQYKKT